MFTLLKLINNGVVDDEFILYCDICERMIKNNYAIKKNHEKSVKHNILLSLKKIHLKIITMLLLKEVFKKKVT